MARTSYPNFVAQQIGLDASPVELLYYDLSIALPSTQRHCCCGVSERAFGTRAFRFWAINCDGPGETPFGKPRKSHVLGHAFGIEADASRPDALSGATRVKLRKPESLILSSLR